MSRIKWDKELTNKLVKLYPQTNTEELATILGISVDKIRHQAKRIGVAKDMPKFWNEKTVARLKEIFPKAFNRDICLELGCSMAALTQKAYKLKIHKDESWYKENILEEFSKKGYEHRLKAGCPAWNKGVKNSTGISSTRFKKGIVSSNYMPVGSMRFEKRDSEPWIKIGTPSKWTTLRRYLWLGAGKEIPLGYKLVLIDGNKDNVTLENLMCIPESALLDINAKREVSPYAEEIVLVKKLNKKLNKVIKDNDTK